MTATATASSCGVVESVNMESCMGVSCKGRLVPCWPMMVGGVPYFLFWKFLEFFMGRYLVAMWMPASFAFWSLVKFPPHPSMLTYPRRNAIVPVYNCFLNKAGSMSLPFSKLVFTFSKSSVVKQCTGLCWNIAHIASEVVSFSSGLTYSSTRVSGGHLISCSPDTDVLTHGATWSNSRDYEVESLTRLENCRNVGLFPGFFSVTWP